jgi:hypothetical protein
MHPLLYVFIVGNAFAFALMISGVVITAFTGGWEERIAKPRAERRLTIPWGLFRAGAAIAVVSNLAFLIWVALQ